MMMIGEKNKPIKPSMFMKMMRAPNMTTAVTPKESPTIFGSRICRVSKTTANTTHNDIAKVALPTINK